MATATSPFFSPPAPVQSVPALRGLPLIGNMLDFRRDRLALHDAAAEVGPVTRFNIMHLPIYSITDADVAKAVLVDQAASFKKSAGMQFLAPLLGEGLLSVGLLSDGRKQVFERRGMRVAGRLGRGVLGGCSIRSRRACPVAQSTVNWKLCLCA